MLLRLAALAACLLAPGAARADPPTRVVTVAAAADLKFALDELIAAWRARAPDVEVRVTYGSSGGFFAQIANGAPYDLFLSADAVYPRRLVEAGLAAKERVFPYATGRLSVWVPASSRLDLQRQGLAALLDPSVRRVAIANPAHAPYGRAAEAALLAAGLLDRVRPKLVLGENVAQAAQFVQSGNAEAGLVARSLTRAPVLLAEGRSWDVPASAHPRLEQAGVILSSSREPRAAADFAAWLTGQEGRAALARWGFEPPGP